MGSQERWGNAERGWQSTYEQALRANTLLADEEARASCDRRQSRFYQGSIRTSSTALLRRQQNRLPLREVQRRGTCIFPTDFGCGVKPCCFRTPPTSPLGLQPGSCPPDSLSGLQVLPSAAPPASSCTHRRTTNRPGSIGIPRPLHSSSGPARSTAGRWLGLAAATARRTAALVETRPTGVLAVDDHAAPVSGDPRVLLLALEGRGRNEREKADGEELHDEMGRWGDVVPRRGLCSAAQLKRCGTAKAGNPAVPSTHSGASTADGRQGLAPWNVRAGIKSLVTRPCSPRHPEPPRFKL